MDVCPDPSIMANDTSLRKMVPHRLALLLPHTNVHTSERTYVCIRVKVQINAARPPYFQYQIQEHFFRATLPRLNLTDTTQTKRNICAGLVLSQHRLVAVGLDDISFDLWFYIENNYVSRGSKRSSGEISEVWMNGMRCLLLNIVHVYDPIVHLSENWCGLWRLL